MNIKKLLLLILIVGDTAIGAAQNNLPPNYAEKLLSTDIFQNGEANKAIDIILGNIYFWGNLEVEITGSYSYQNSVGKLKKNYALGLNPNNAIYTNESRVAEVMGTMQANIALGELVWDAALSSYKIPVSHLVSTQNNYTIKVKMFSHGGGAEALYNTLSLSSIYTLSALQKNDIYYMSALGIGTTRPGSVPNGSASGAAAMLEVNGNIRVNTKSMSATGETGSFQFLKAHTNDINTIYSTAEIRAFTTSGYDGGLRFYTSQHIGGGNYDLRPAMSINHLGNIGVGGEASADKFSVNGNIRAKKIIVSQTGWPDYVFDSSYSLRSLSEVEKFITKNKHLPGMPSAKEVEERGISVGDNQALLLKKMEEMTLYLIRMNKENNEAYKRINLLERKLNQLQKN